MTCGKTLDGAYDIEADTLTVNESSDLRGFTTVDGPSTFTQDMDLQNPTTLNTITLSASSAIQDYVLRLPPQQGTSGQFFTTDGLGNAAWSSVTPTVAGVSYIGISAPDNFMTVNGSASASTYTSATFNLELSGALPTLYGGTGLSVIGTANQILSSTGSVLEWKNSSGTGNNLLQTSPTLINPNIGAASGTSLILSSLTASRLVFTDDSKNLVSVGYNTQHFNISANQFNHLISNPFTYSNSSLELKLKKTRGLNGLELNKLFITPEGELDLNLQDLIYPGSGLRKIPLLELALGLGIDLTGLGGLPDLTILGLDIDTEVLDFKFNKLSIKSLGQSRVPYYNAFKLTSKSTFLYNDALNELSVDRVLLNDSVTYNSDNRRAATKAYVDNLNTFESNSGLEYTQASGDSTRIWTIRLNSDFLGVDENNDLITKITGADGKCITVTPENKILLTYNTKHFGETVGGANAGELFSKLETTTASCIVLDPDYKLDLGINTNHFSVVSNKLTSKLTNVAGNCVLINPDYELYLDFNTDNFSLVAGKLNIKLSSSGAIVGTSATGLAVDVDTTYLAITTNQITLTTTIVTKINKIDTIETELNTTKGKVTTLEGKMTTVEGNITTLQGKVTTAEGTITSHSGTLTTHTGQITALQGQIGGAIGAGVGGGIVGAGAGIAGGVLGGAGSAVSGIGGAALAGLAGAGGALLGVGVGVLISEDPEPDAEGNPTYSFEIEKLLTASRLVVTDSFKNLASFGIGSIGEVLTRKAFVAPQTVTAVSGNGTAVTMTVTGGIDTFPIGSEVYIAGFGVGIATGVETVIGGSSTVIQISSTVTTFPTLGTIETFGMQWSPPATSGIYYLTKRNCHFSSSNSPINPISHWRSNNFIRDFCHNYRSNSIRCWSYSSPNLPNTCNPKHWSGFRNIFISLYLFGSFYFTSGGI